MKPAGFILKVDQLGRVVIPKPIRNKYELKTDDTLEVFIDDNGFFLKKYLKTCTFCGKDENLTDFKDKVVCKDCLKELKGL